MCPNCNDNNVKYEHNTTNMDDNYNIDVEIVEK